MIKKFFLSAAVLVSALSNQAQAEVVHVDGLWHAFDVDADTSNSGNLEWIDLDGNLVSFEFTLTQSAYLTVVDAGFAGDSFAVYDGNANQGGTATLLGQTSAAVNTYPGSVVLDFDQALANSNYSSGKFLLAAGQHSIFGLLSTSALDDTGAAINATVGAVSLTPVPLPAAVWLYLTGAGAIGWWSRRDLTAVRG